MLNCGLLICGCLEMKFIIAAIYTDFKTMIIDDEGVEQMDMYTAPPKSGKLIIRLEHAEA